MFLENLNSLMKSKNINRRTLSIESGIPYSTIDGWYKKGWNNISLSTLKKLSAYFDISIDALVNNESHCKNSLTLSEKAFLEKYRQLDRRGTETLSVLLDAEYNRSRSANASYNYTDAPQKPLFMVAEHLDD